MCSNIFSTFTMSRSRSRSSSCRLLSLCYGINNNVSPDQTSPHLADAEEVTAGEPDGDDGHDEEVEHAEDGDDENIPGHAAVDCRHGDTI